MHVKYHRGGAIMKPLLDVTFELETGGIKAVLQRLIDFSISLGASGDRASVDVHISLSLLGFGFEVSLQASDTYGLAAVGADVWTPIISGGFLVGCYWTCRLDRQEQIGVLTDIGLRSDQSPHIADLVAPADEAEVPDAEDAALFTFRHGGR